MSVLRDMTEAILERDPSSSTTRNFDFGVERSPEGASVAVITNPSERLWRTDFKLGRNIYALLSNDETRPSNNDPLIGTMETSELAEIVVETHNLALKKFGRHYKRALAVHD
jgi:hypothetical protein